MYLNKVFVLGNLTRDPELKSLPSGIPVANFGIATNRIWKDRDENKQEGAEIHNIVVFNRQGELCAHYLKKGQSVLIEGRIQTRSWDAQDGQKRYRTEIIAERVQFGPKAGGGGYQGEGGQGQTGGGASGGSNSSGSRQEPPTIEYPEEETINPDDIPF